MKFNKTALWYHNIFFTKDSFSLGVHPNSNIVLNHLRVIFVVCFAQHFLFIAFEEVLET
jgi:hypothetical protein